jgi:lactocepin
MTTNTSISVTLTPELRLERALKQAGIEKPSKITQLIVSGTLTNNDFKFIRQKMNKTLKELDMSEASIEDNKIGYKTFTVRLTSVSIPDSVTAINDYEFDKIKSLININVHPNNPSYSSEEGVCFNKDKTKLLKYPRGRKEELYTIPDSVKRIERSAFWDSNLTSITIPNSVTEIDEYAFMYCDNLISIVIPDSVKEIGNSIFYLCENLTSVTIPDSIISIGNYAFWNCKRLVSINIPNSVKKIGNSAFAGCNMLSSITIPDSVEEIGSWAFENCNRLTSLFIPSSVTKIGEQAFGECFNLTIHVDSDNPVYSSENGVLFNKDRTVLLSYPVKQHGDYVIPSSVKKIERYAFHKCSRLTSISIPDSVAEIGFYAFSNCTGLSTVDIPDSVIEIDLFAFDDCPAFITVHPDSPVYKSINGELFNNNAIT